MRIRTIKPEFFLHDGLFDAEKETSLPLRVAFAGLWCASDREGRFKWEPRRLGVSILPYDNVDFSRVLDALTTRGFIVKYRVNDAFFGMIPSWHTHQFINPRESKSELPEPTKEELVVTPQTSVIDACSTREDASRKEGKGREGKGSIQQDQQNTGPDKPEEESQKQKIKRPRDPLFDELARAEGCDPLELTSSAARTVAVSLAEIRKVFPELPDGEITRRAHIYHRQFPTWALTAPALAKHWARCGGENSELHLDAESINRIRS
jgi:hypothetical protein